MNEYENNEQQVNMKPPKEAGKAKNREYTVVVYAFLALFVLLIGNFVFFNCKELE